MRTNQKVLKEKKKKKGGERERENKDINDILAVDARQELDLKVGVAFTRFQTRFFQGKYGNLDSTVISYGPCQTPTLSFCVERHDRIQGFQPESFWSIKVTVKNSDTSTNLTWNRERVFDRQVGHLFFKMTEEAKGNGAR